MRLGAAVALYESQAGSYLTTCTLSVDILDLMHIKDVIDSIKWADIKLKLAIGVIIPRHL